MIAYTLMVNGYSQMVGPIFNVNLGISPIVIGWVTALARLWDSITDPLMGSISDNTRTRLGRRRPWILTGVIAGAILFSALWWTPSGQSEHFYAIWLLAGSLMFYLGFTIFSVPYIALGMEMSPDYHERTRIVAVRSFISPIGAFAAQSLFWFATLSVFSSPIQGMRWTAVGVSALVIICGITTVLGAREHPDSQRITTRQKKMSPLASIRQTLTVPPFLIICAITSISLTSVMLVGQLGFYVNLYYIYAGNQSASAGVFAIAGLAYQLGSMFSVPVISWISTHIGKRHTLMIFMGIAIVGAASKWWLYTPASPYLQLIPNAVMGIGYTATSLLCNAMIPECCDYDELATGTRREGMFSAVYSWTYKLGIAIAMLGSGYILTMSGFDVELAGNQQDSTLTSMRLLLAVVPILGLATSLILAWFYPITEEHAYDIQDQLNTKRVAH